ncbi:MAG: N-acetyl-D-muramate 6-phosphate phosphatase [Pseudomonadota bacterium]|nr:N-acetyl-D-muramate 6-phosphate phosphatase [Pseudomonadota bacterium]
MLFDLDGTLIDTAPDMAKALNLLLAEEGKHALPYETIRPVVSNGSAALVQLGFGDNLPEIDRLKKRYLEIYQAHLCEDSKLFDGMTELLQHIEQHNMNWGVVTNKPGWLTEPLMQQIGLSHRAAAIVSGDTTLNRKPHPEPMLHACLRAGSEPAQCIYIGDAQRDIEAGNNAGMQTVVALYGYIGDRENTTEWKASYQIRHPREILELI